MTELKLIPSWSFSKVQDFERCKLACRFKHLDRIPEPQRELKPGQTEHANDRGTRVHDNCEMYVSGQTDDLCSEAEKNFGPQIDLLRVLYGEGLVSLEGEWGMDHNWEPTEWKTAWLRLKLDAMVMLDPTHAIVIDYKTGRKFGNEIKHAEQLQLYQLATFLRYPMLERVTAELWYLDQPKENVTSVTYTRRQGLMFRNSFTKRGTAVTTNTNWKPSPNKYSCQWCGYHQDNGGPCTVGAPR